MRILICLLAGMLCACAERTVPVEPPPPGCDNLYVILPGNFIIDLAAESDVVLNPGAQEFVLFCAPGLARKALEAELAGGRLPAKDDWRIYRLQGTFAEIASVCGKERYCLDRPAKLAEWVDMD